MDEFYSPTIIIVRHHRGILQTINIVRHYRWILQTINVCVIIDQFYRPSILCVTIDGFYRPSILCVIIDEFYKPSNTMHRSLSEAQTADRRCCVSTGVNLQTVRNVRHYQRIHRPPTSRVTNRITEYVSLQRRLSIRSFLAWVKDKCIPRH